MIKLYLAFLLVEIIVIYLLSRSLTSKIFLLLYRSTKNKQKSALLFALIFLPGTFIHESAHFLAALFLLVPVWQMELVPQFDEKTQSLKLGSIPIGKTDMVRRFLIGVAPFILGTSLVFFFLQFAIDNQLLTQPLPVAILTLFLFQITNTMFSSKEDLHGFIELTTLLLVLYLVWILLRIKFPILDFKFNLDIIPPGKFIEFLKTATVLLLPPLILDLLLLTLTSSLLNRPIRERPLLP